MAVTETSLTVPLFPAPAPEPAPSAPAAPVGAAPAAPAAVPTPPAPQVGPSPLGFALHFDPDTQRMFLESRDPVSGFVIYQIPSKYVIKQLSASVSAPVAPSRGTKVDSAL